VVGDDAVGLIQRGSRRGTGFLIAHNRLMTNEHVLPDSEAARQAKVRFGYRLLGDGTLHEGIEVDLAPDTYIRVNEALDYCVVALARSVEAEPCDLRHGKTVEVGDPVSVVGHPRGRPMEVVNTDAAVVRVEPPTVGYRADTETSSSGSPVFDAAWNVIALHHHSAPAARDDRGNEGILISAIAADLG
jgi:endonuclease G, mitochondrial